jgi:hypothetical protein
MHLSLIDSFPNFIRQLKKLICMLELSKQILQKVSFDSFLFEKELRKSIRWIKREEVLVLQTWCLATFGHLYSDVITNVFEKALS